MGAFSLKKIDSPKDDGLIIIGLPLKPGVIRFTGGDFP
jgi:hypothetical protein